MESQLQRIIDEAAIREVHLRYCRGIDRMDWELVRSCYHPGAVDDHGPFRGTIDEFIAWAAKLLPTFVSTTHFIGNQLVEVNGDSAWMESYSRAYHRKAPAGALPATDWVLNLRYIDRLERRDGHWRIVERVATCDTERTDPVGGEHAILGPGFHRGTRDKTDPSYSRGLVHDNA
ncbi:MULTISPECIES: nuclear transport factor 2 family protein [unclassified Rhodococcus (in: high G+C Gram-positive bacteria)]|uniref:nuclear transport factor 2 family protein n=1 Tax=unclassified Rhodococcus (in: high G+C Gram-positive bacteria) TaxID=192944 RepID=UPI00163AC575|nr:MULTISPECIES: nuclear transport factor 2 family protein [unclassified Rhodococcus (in: high G+C Gram-positive bacteria)]MBC2637572.1 nuclear transport factor 2 family protein [Rhodococcus sp. 3A]MBC2644291.1 nuclear transport factor 2 family protein [Rhodococcus sp. 3A]MBC2890973.1 nuclear transport factor 2 family protein [Rhodococcus sp. 4CII]MBC2897682.1 nuclear transport factor 2 family protein [Rhodococcus sp. 4CII]